MTIPMAGRPAPRAASRYGFGPTGRTLRCLPRAKDLHHFLGHQLVALFLVLLWPVVPWMKFQDKRHARGAARDEAEQVFKVHQSHLLQRCSVEEVESRERSCRTH